MSEENIKLRADLARSEEKLAERTLQRDQFELALINSDNELTKIHSEFTDATHIHSTNLATLASKLTQAETLLGKSDKNLAEQKEKLAEFRAEATSMDHERECFVEALQELKKPLSGGTQILEYIAAGKVTPERRSEILKQIIDSNKGLITGADRLATAALELSLRTNELDQSNKDLVTRTEELAGVNAELRLMMQQREDFVAAVTHDLKNPLIGGTRILEYIVDGSVESDRQSEILLQVIESNKNMLMMIWNMLDVYRSDSGALVPVPETINIAELLNKCVGEFSFVIKEKKIELAIEIAAGLPEISSDKILLRRVLVNLLDNAVKFTPEGGRIFVSAAGSEHQLQLTVTNSGAGLSVLQLGRIFQRFWQTESGRQYGIGTGLGLFVSKQIIESLDGQIACTSTEHQSTTFTLTLNQAKSGKT